SILPPRRLLAPCSPITQAIASTTLLLPDPLGPTTHVIPGSKCSVVDDANDLNPRAVIVLRYKPAALLQPRRKSAARLSPGSYAPSPTMADLAGQFFGWGQRLGWEPLHQWRATPPAGKI